MAVTDLTGTKWYFNQDVSNNSNFEYSIDFTIGLNNFSSLKLLAAGYPVPTDEIYLTYNDTQVYVHALGAPGWLDQSYRTIEITGGTDATNASLISWLEANAEQIIEPTANEYTLTQTLTNLTNSNITLTITADEGYSLPAQADIVVTGGSIVSYDDTTGELVVTAGTTAVEVTCESAVSTISFSIDGTTYQAEENMTWAQWVDSAYNTDGYTIANNKVYSSADFHVAHSISNIEVNSTDTIVSGEEYILYPDGGGND